MSEYKNTLNLPKTDFPMKADLSKREPSILHQWESLNLYEKIREVGKKRKKFIFLDGPPYANGHIHMGTAVNKVLKDIVVKSKTLSGFDVPFIPGWDCHGLPIEINIEKKVGKPGQKVAAAEFRQLCRDFAMTQINYQREEFKRLGVIADWPHPYLTMDFGYEAGILRSLAKIYQAGYMQRGAIPVYWCLDCASALAEAEVEYKDKTSSAVDVRFRVLDRLAFLKCFENPIEDTLPISVPIWTTTPWTLPANQAVALNPYLDYSLIEIENKERILVASPLVEAVQQRLSLVNCKEIGKARGEGLEKIMLQHPLYDRTVPIISAQFVTVESGTGAVHIAGAHGPDDYAAASQYHLPMIQLLADNGCFTQEAGFIAGMHVSKVNEPIIEALNHKQALLHSTTISHSFPHCWRHKTALIFRATPQWFIAMDKNRLREDALDAIRQVNWIPSWGLNRIYSMVENRPDWCISRQRAWGVPIAIFLHKETDQPHPDTGALMEKIALRLEKEGIEGWFHLEPEELLGSDAASYKKCMDILDVWFDSGVAHQCVLRSRPPLDFPADLFLEGSDQHRGWFHSSLLTSIAMNQAAPYKAVLTHGYVIDIEGRKMSKSLGNVIAPETIIQNLGADVLRLWAASIDYRSDIFVSDEILMRTSETYRRLRNTSRFLLANLAGFDPERHCVPVKKMLALDRYILDKASTLQDDIIKAYDTYQFHQIYQKIHQFCSVDLGGFYLDVIKDRQYTLPTDSLPRRSTQTAMYYLMEAMVRWFAPILSFTAEEIWQYLPGKRNESVFLNTWYLGLPKFPEKERMNAAFWEEVRRVRDAVNKDIERLRNSGQLGSSLEAAVELYCEPELKAQLDTLGDELRFVLITSSAQVFAESSVSDSVETDIPGLKVKVVPVSFEKCERCWHRREDVGSHTEHPTLCGRCVDNVFGKGEVRYFA